jgi:TPR repeat protein
MIEYEVFDNITADALFLQGKHKEAFERYFYGATGLHDSRAAFDVAYMYHRGFHVPTNYPLARKFYRAAAALEGGAALFNLALMEIRGLGAPPDLRAAARHMEEAAAIDCIDAQLYLGTAYTLGCVFDPLNIECLSMIPFYRVISRTEQRLLWNGTGDPTLEDERYSVIEADEQAAVEMFERATRHRDDTYVSPQIGAARVAVGQALIEGFGMEYDPRRGYQLLERAALENGSREAAAFLVAHQQEARVWGIPERRLAMLSQGED